MAFATAREAGNAGQQSQCIGMSRPIVYPVHRTFLHQSSRVHDAYAVAETCHHTQVMGNVENGRTDLLLEIRQEVQHHRLSSHIQSRGGFIQDEQIWVRHQGHGDDTTLYHPPGELVWIPGHNGRRIRHLHPVQNTKHAGTGLTTRGPEMEARYFLQLSAHAQRRIEGGAGILIDHGYPGTPDLSAFRGRYLRIPRAKVLFPEPDSPTKPMTSPRSKVRSTPFTACVPCWR